jgi:hypothetical protein
MTPADLTFAPRLRGRCARAPVVRRPRQARQPGLCARLAPTWAARWRLSKGAGVVEDAAEEVSWDLPGGRSTPVDHAGRDPGSRLPLRTPIGERDADLRDEHHAESHVQLRAPATFRGLPRIRSFSARRCAEPRRSGPVPEPFLSRREPSARVGQQKPPRSDPRGLRRFSPEVRAFRALCVRRRGSRACSQRARSERDERRVGQLSCSLSCPVGREKPRRV